MNLNFLNNDFTVLDKKKDKYLLILIVLVFTIVFINLFKPWNIGRWFSDSGIIKFLRLSSYGGVVALVLLFTQFPLRRLLKVEFFKIKTYILWIVIEIVLICLVYIVMYGNPIGNFVNDLVYALRYTVLGIWIPYSFAVLVIYYKNQRQEIQNLQLKIAQPSEKKLIAFKDENGKIKFSVLVKDLLILESTDNYVSVFYILNGKVQRQLLRNTMKNLEESFKKGTVIRCHRSFMVNLGNVEFVKREGKKLKLKVRLMDQIIPVSEKYTPLFLDFLS